MNPTPPPTDLPTLKANAEAAIVFLKDIGYDGFSNTLRAYLDALERMNDAYRMAREAIAQCNERLYEKANAELERENDKPNNSTAAGLKYALDIVAGRRVLKRNESYIAALDEMDIFLKAALERVENGEPPHSFAVTSNERTELERGCQEPTEIERLRSEQSACVMPLIGGLLDAWDGLSNDLKGDDELTHVRKYIQRIDDAMERRKYQEPTEVECLRQDAKVAWHYWNELAENPDTDPVDINAAGKDYYAKQQAYDKARAIAPGAQPTLTFSDALRIARGCFTKHDDTCNLFQEGIQTVINALEEEQQKAKT